MKVAFDHQIFVKQQFGGISRYIVTLAEHILQKEHSVCAFTPIHQNYYLKRQLPDHFWGRYYGKFPPKSISLFLMVNKLLASNRIKKWDADVLHATYYASKQYKQLDVPLVVTVHDMTHEIYPDQTYRSKKVSKLKEASIKNADHVICISENTRKDLHKYVDVPEDKVSVIHHGANTLNHHTRSDKYQDICELSPYILFVGDRGGYKNFITLLKVFDQSNMLRNNFKLIAFGGGEFGYEEKKLIDGFNLNSQVYHIQGDDRVLGDLYKQAQLFVYPSLYEGFGMPTLEAMSCGCPVAASQTSSIPEVVGNAAVLFNPLEVESMCETIEDVISVNEKRETLVTQGYERIKEFSWVQCAQKTLEVYQRIT